MAWYMQLGPAIFQDDLSESLYDEMSNRAHPTFLADIMAQTDSPWCDNVRSFPAESCADIAQEALDTALDDLTERLGDDMTKWQWGDIHFTYYPHNPFTEVSPLNRIFDRKIANGGDTYTVNVAPVRFEPRYEQRWVPSYRHLVDHEQPQRQPIHAHHGPVGQPAQPPLRRPDRTSPSRRIPAHDLGPGKCDRGCAGAGTEIDK